jgi:hypothetical protein
LRPLTTFLHQDFILAGKFTLRFSEHMIPETKRARIIEALKAHPNASAVARNHGVSSSAVCTIAKRANIKLAGRLAGKKVLSAEQCAQIIAALHVNPNASAAGRHYGVAGYRVRRIAEAAKIDLSKKVTAEKRAQIIEALKANTNANAVAREHGVSTKTVTRMAKQANIALNWKLPPKKQVGAGFADIGG